MSHPSHIPALMAVLGSSLACVGTSTLVDADPPLQEVVTADYVRVAFFELVPGPLTSKLRGATTRQCQDSSDAEWQALKEALPWLCGRKLTFFRAVYVTGSRGREGFVCDAQDGPTNLTYYPGDVFLYTPQPCARFYYDSLKLLHFEKKATQD